MRRCPTTWTDRHGSTRRSSQPEPKRQRQPRSQKRPHSPDGAWSQLATNPTGNFNGHPRVPMRRCPTTWTDRHTRASLSQSQPPEPTQSARAGSVCSRASSYPHVPTHYTHTGADPVIQSACHCSDPSLHGGSRPVSECARVSMLRPIPLRSCRRVCGVCVDA